MSFSLYEGAPLQGAWQKLMNMQYEPLQTSETRGRSSHYELETSFLYVVRLGKQAVIMPRMAYSDSVAGVFMTLYGKESPFIGKRDMSQACGDHS